MHAAEANKLLQSIEWHDAYVDCVKSSAQPRIGECESLCVDIFIQLTDGVVMLRLYECSEVHIVLDVDIEVCCSTTPSGRLSVRFAGSSESSICKDIDVYIMRRVDR
jgi:hypothetical protein